MLHYLFVYGTLRKAQNGDIHPFLKNQTIFIDRASVPGKLYLIDTYPGAIPTAADSSGRIQGEVYRLLHPERLLPTLDEYEECTSHFPKPHEYQRQATHVILGNGKTIDAWIYWFRRPIKKLRQITSGDYFDYLPASHEARSK